MIIDNMDSTNSITNDDTNRHAPLVADDGPAIVCYTIIHHTILYYNILYYNILVYYTMLYYNVRVYNDIKR